MSDDIGFTPPPFDPDAALRRLRRELRELGLSEREGVFERRGLAVARARIDDGQLAAALAEHPSRTSPRWQPRTLRDNAAVRDFAAAVKRALQQRGDRDE
jgi:hypothetical protein